VTLWDDTPGQFHRDGPDTEREAAFAIVSTARQRLLVLRVLGAFPDGLTDDEIAEQTGLYRYSAAPRRYELRDRGLVVDSGDRRLTPHGRRAIVWQITGLGRLALQEAVA
jgi:hypothetical protein